MATATSFNDEYFYTELSMATKFGHGDNYGMGFPQVTKVIP